MFKSSCRPKVCTQASRLLDLPPELRNNIYEMIFGESHLIRPNVDLLFHIAAIFERSGQRVAALRPASVLELALTCRQVHNEALRFYYGRNFFAFNNTYDLYRYLYMIGEERRHCIKSIEIFWEGDRRREAAELIGECISLQRLYIGVGCNTTTHTKHPQENLWASRGMGQLRKMRGFPNLDLRIREVNAWGPASRWRAFELTIRGAHQSMFTAWPPKFDADHIAKFEKGLKEDMGRAVQGSEIEKGDVVVEDHVQTMDPTNVKTMASTSRVLRTRKVSTKTLLARRTRKMPVRKAGKKGEASRRVRR